MQVRASQGRVDIPQASYILPARLPACWLEEEMVDAINQWREAHGLRQVVLAGHSFGGYLASAYALKYPEHVRHLVLVDPWGLAPKPEQSRPGSMPWWMRTVVSALSSFPPFSLGRCAARQRQTRARPPVCAQGTKAQGLGSLLLWCSLAGPYGVDMLKQLRPQLGLAYREHLQDHDLFYKCADAAAPPLPCALLATAGFHPSVR
jgi:pimeloyl-ACP methyl ester carboxylesterase